MTAPSDSVAQLDTDDESQSLYRCPTNKQGRFARLRCILKYGHEGAHNFVILGVREEEEHPRRKPTKPKAKWFP